MGNAQRWRTLTPEQKLADEEAIAAAYQDMTQTTKSILREHHISCYTLYSIIDARGIPRRATGVHREIDEAAFIRDYTAGVSMADITRTYKISSKRLMSILQERGIPKRKQMTRKKQVLAVRKCRLCGILLSEVPSHGKYCDECRKEYPGRVRE